jgi:protein SCO1
MMKRPWLWTVFAVTLLTIPAVATIVARAQRHKLPSYGTVPAFQLTDQTGQPFGARDLAGKVWVADFVFTRCSQICPRLTEEMSKLQRYLTNRGTDARTHLVSISVDPERDTPEVLAGYAKGFDAKPGFWKFLTGPAKEVEDAVVKGFKQGMEKEPDFSILHGSKFVLVDAKGTIRGFFDSTDPVQMAVLREAISNLLAQGGS